jgi:hypothetical protein
MVIHNAILTGSISMQAPPVISGSLTLTGSITSTGPITGSGFFTAGTITAQTLVVQTITSSVSFITGSTKFGVLAANTHQFTGSVYMNANTNGLFVSSSGQIGINTITPNVNTFSGAAKGIEMYTGAGGYAVIKLNSADLGNFYLVNGVSQYWLYGEGNYPMVFYTSGSERMRITASGSVGIGTSTPLSTFVVNGNNAGGRGGEISIVNIGGSTVGSEAALNFGFGNSSYNGDNGNGQIKAVFASGNEATDMVFSSWNGSAWGEKMRIFSNGNVAIQDTFVDNGAKLCITSGAKAGVRIVTDATYNAVSIGGTGKFSMDAPGVGSGRFLIDDSGYVYAPLLQSGAGTYAMKWTTSTGQFTKDTSSARYKDNIRDSVYGLSDIMKLRSAMFEYKNDKRTDIGLIAEEVNEIIPILAIKDEQGRPDAVSYDRFVSILIKAIQELKAEFDEYKTTHP